MSGVRESCSCYRKGVLTDSVPPIATRDKLMKDWIIFNWDADARTSDDEMCHHFEGMEILGSLASFSGHSL